MDPIDQPHGSGEGRSPIGRKKPTTLRRRSRKRNNVPPPWAELPPEVTAAILQRLGAIDMLTTAQSVCKAWRSVCRDTSTWQSVDMRNPCYLRTLRFDLKKICRVAVIRSHGKLTDIAIEDFCTNELLLYISQRSSQLKRLQLEFCPRVTGSGLIQAVRSWHLLEELHLYYTRIDPFAIGGIGRSCPLLKSFTLVNYKRKPRNNEALAIAENMPGLRHLQLIGNAMTNEGLWGILEGCDKLESLDLRGCLNVEFGGEIGRVCGERIRDLKRPHDSLDDYRFRGGVYDSDTDSSSDEESDDNDYIEDGDGIYDVDNNEESHEFSDMYITSVSDSDVDDGI